MTGQLLRRPSEITPESAGWAYAGLTIVTLPAGGARRWRTGADEAIVLPLRGAAQVVCDGEKFSLDGRAGVFTRVSDFAYLPRDATVELSSAAGGRFAVATARARRRLPPRYGPAEHVQVELRGAGAASRQVNNFCVPERFPADRLIAVEVLTPGGNWSSYPPHKHDEGSAEEPALEEIYYFEGNGYLRVYGASETCAHVGTGDAVLVPRGWHGPAMAPPGYHLYYLNVMAGPGERSWQVRDDPGYAWVRGTWPAQPVDARLPLTTAVERGAPCG